MNDSPFDRTLPSAGDPAGPAESAAVERAMADQREQWGRGDRAPVEAILEQFPALRDDDEGLLCLIFNEVILREGLGESPRPEEYQGRFPRLAASIALQFAVDQALRPDSHGSATIPAPANGPGDANAAQGTAPSLPGYEILAELGRGGMGVVYKARQLGFNRVVAVKMILAGANLADRKQRFRVEAEAVARLQHPHIVHVYEVGEQDGVPFFSMEFCPGGGLDRKLNGTPLPPREAAPLVENLARAFHAAHQAHVVHRDLKPANVLLTGDGSPKVTDFGLAKKLDGEGGQTQSGSIMGTPSYMAPEQAGGRWGEVGPAADVYSLGAILYECLTGRPPFKAASLLETLAQVAADDPVPPRRLQPKTPRDLETICLKCLEKAPARRYPTALALADDLRRFQAGEPVRARPVKAPERAWKWVRTHKALAALAAAALVTLPAGVVWTVLAVAQSRDLSRQGEEDLNEASKLLAEGRWAEARAAVRQGQDRLGRAGSADLLRKAGRLADDVETAARLEEAPLLRTEPGREGWDFEGVNRAYREAFTGYGLEPVASDPDVAAARVGASAIKDRLTQALDDWLLNGQKGDDALNHWLLEVLCRADPDECRCMVRAAAMENDREELGRLADDPGAAPLSPATTILLADALTRTGSRAKALPCCAPPSRRTRTTSGSTTTSATTWTRPAGACRRRRSASCGPPSPSGRKTPGSTSSWAAPCYTGRSSRRRRPTTGGRSKSGPTSPSPTPPSASR